MAKKPKPARKKPGSVKPGPRKPAAKKAAKKPARRKTTRAAKQEVPTTTGPGSLNEALLVTYGGEAFLGVVEYSHTAMTKPIEDFVVHVEEVSARPSDPVINAHLARQVARQIFTTHDHSDRPYLRVIGRVLDELLNYRERKKGRGYTSCSGGDVYLLLLNELQAELPEEHRQERDFDRTADPGRKTINNRLNELRGVWRRNEPYTGPLYAQTTSTTAGGADQGYTLTEIGKWLFDGWPELPELIRGRLPR